MSHLREPLLDFLFWYGKLSQHRSPPWYKCERSGDKYSREKRKLKHIPELRLCISSCHERDFQVLQLLWLRLMQLLALQTGDWGDEWAWGCPKVKRLLGWGEL